MWNGQSHCVPTEPIHVLQIHGTLDPIIYWLGGYIVFTPYPSVNTTIEYWATHNGCSTTATNGGNFNFDNAVLFDETTRWIYGNCDDPAAGSSELWEVFGGSHFQFISTEGIEMIFDYLDTHTKPIPSCHADVNADQHVDVSDVLFVIGQWGDGDPSADVNNDGTVNVNDLLIVISAWGPCE